MVRRLNFNVFLCIIWCLFFYTFTNSEQEPSETFSCVDAYGIPLDLKLMDIMKITNGIFIEVGAFDGVTYSNTKLLEKKYGWTGVLIEPSENLFHILKENRPGSRCFQCALGPFKENNTYGYGDFDGHPMSSLTQRINRPANKKVLIRSLQSILDECNIHHVNLFSLDTEGYEFKVLQGIDFNKTTFDYILIEIYIDQMLDISEFLNDKGYEYVDCLSNYNTILNPNWDGTHNDYLFKRKSL